MLLIAHFDLVINHIKGVLTDMCQSFVTLFFKMAQGSMVTKAQLKRELESLSKDLFNLDLQIQDVKSPKQFRRSDQKTTS